MRRAVIFLPLKMAKGVASNSARRFTYDAASESFPSLGGLVYGQGSTPRNRLTNVPDHTVTNPSKPIHLVFNAAHSQDIGLVDEARCAIVGPGTRAATAETSAEN